MSASIHPHLKSVWSTQDFEQMGWHDNAVHAIAFEPALPSPGRLMLDIDYIVEWIAPANPSGNLEFSICPATLVFDDASDLQGDLSFVGTAFEPSLNGVSSDDIDKYGLREWTLDGHEFTLRLRAAGFTQYLRQPPIRSSSHRLTVEDRGGLSFEECGFQ